MTSVSIAMATYNGARYVGRQLQSIAAQEYPATELVVTDDGSDDDTLSIVAEFAKVSRLPVRIHRNESRLGYRASFMHAAGLCKSDLICFCDQDDIWHSRKLLACVSRFSEREILLVYHNANVAAEDGAQVGSLDNFAAAQPIMPPLSFWPMSHSLGFTQVFRRCLIRLFNLWPTSLDHHNVSEPMAHDQWCFFLASVFGKIGYVAEPLVTYMQHTENTYGWIRKPQIMGQMQLLFTNAQDQSLRFAKAAKRRAEILEAADLEEPWRERAEVAARSYRRMSELYAHRNEIYSSPNLSARLHAFRRILACGGYSGRWSLGRRFFIQDTFIGVPIAPMLNRTNS